VRKRYLPNKDTAPLNKLILFVVSTNFLYGKLLRSMVWLDLHILRELYQNYMAHNKNLTAFGVESEKQMSDI
jgi:hypothetical protein